MDEAVDLGESEAPLAPEYARDPAGMVGCWIVGQTLVRHERKVAERLLWKGIECYVPLTQRWKRNGGRNRCLVEVPLFDGYVFAAPVNSEDFSILRDVVAERGGLYGLIHVADQAQLRRDLISIHRMLEDGAMLRATAQNLKGRKCRVVRGPLLGKEAEILDVNGRSQLLVTFEWMNTSVVMDNVELDDVELL